jgi:DNA polymerase III epsilon subunit-like protein
MTDKRDEVWFILDTETTSSDPEEAELVEVAVVAFDPRRRCVIDQRSTLFQVHEDSWSYEAEEVHGIPQSVANDFGVSPVLGVPRLVKYLNTRPDAPILAHNAAYDQRVLDRACASLQQQQVNHRRWVCTYTQFDWPKGTGSLTNVALSHGVALMAAHRALDDCQTLARLLEQVGGPAYGRNLKEMMDFAQLPRKRYKSSHPRSRNDDVKRLGFRWDPDRKIWWKDLTDCQLKDTRDRLGQMFQLTEAAG